AYLPAGTPRAANRRAGASWAKWAFHCASRLIEGGDYRSAAIQLWEGLRCSRSPEVLWEAARVVRNGARQAPARYGYPTRGIGWPAPGLYRERALMQQDNSCRIVIPPVPDGIARPLWSVMIPTFNCASYLRETLRSVLTQDPGRDVMQIEVVDDCS